MIIHSYFGIFFPNRKRKFLETVDSACSTLSDSIALAVVSKIVLSCSMSSLVTAGNVLSLKISLSADSDCLRGEFFQEIARSPRPNVQFTTEYPPYSCKRHRNNRTKYHLYNMLLPTNPRCKKKRNTSTFSGIRKPS